MSNADALLLEIQQAVGCSYLSDLRSYFGLLSKQMRVSLMEIPLERYALQDWNVAASYILNGEYSFPTVEDAKAKILAGR